LVLRVYQELSHREIAEILDSPVGTVKANLYFALQNLRKVVENEKDIVAERGEGLGGAGR
jgi:RNA polymerase sigma-70 factor (ECF subfamily)